MTHVGFTGTRQGMTLRQQAALREHFDLEDQITCLHHGDCIKADEEAHMEAVSFGILMWLHPSTLERYRAYITQDVIVIEDPKPPLDRNHHIVDATEYLIAAPKSNQEELRSGTWATVRYARQQHKRVLKIYPDGTEEWEENQED